MWSLRGTGRGGGRDGTGRRGRDRSGRRGRYGGGGGGPAEGAGGIAPGEVGVVEPVVERGAFGVRFPAGAHPDVPGGGAVHAALRPGEDETGEERALGAQFRVGAAG